MSKGDTFENELLAHIFQNADIAGIGDGAGLQNSAADGSLYVALHTATPDETGLQNAGETTYTNYARVAVSRTGSTGWTVTANSVSPTANIDFAECGVTAGAAITHFSVGVSASGASKLLYYGTVTPNITMATGVIPRIKTTSTITED